MKKKITLLLCLIYSFYYSQITIGSDKPSHPSAILEISSSNKGLLIPRINENERDKLNSSAIEGLTIYNTSNHCIEFWNGNAWKDFECLKFFATDCSVVSPIKSYFGDNATPKNQTSIGYTTNYNAGSIAAGTVLGSANGFTVTATNNTNITSGSGTIPIEVTGTAIDATTTNIPLTILGNTDCSVTVDVVIKSLSLNCGTYIQSGTEGYEMNFIRMIQYSSNYPSFIPAGTVLGSSGGLTIKTTQDVNIVPGTGLIRTQVTGIPQGTPEFLPVTVDGVTCGIPLNITGRIVAFDCPGITTINGQEGVPITPVNMHFTYSTTAPITTLKAGDVLGSFNGLTAVVASDVYLDAGEGTVNVIVSGTPTARSNGRILMYIEKYATCSIPLNITGNIFTLDCSIPPVVTTVGLETNSVISVNYTSNYNAGILKAGTNVINGSTTYNGIEIKVLNDTSITNGSGTINLAITGVSTGVIGTNYLRINILGQECYVTLIVNNITPADLPNSYIVKPGTKISFPVTKPYLVWENEANIQRASPWDYSTNENETAVVSWSASSKSTQAPIVSLQRNGKYGTITVDATNVTDEVNAMVLYFDKGTANGVRWSYHIWITNYDPDTNTNGTTYSYNGDPTKVIMDRNLGALGGIYLGRTTPDAQGLRYQWGRKDPFPYLKQNYLTTNGTCDPYTNPTGCTLLPDISYYNFSTPIYKYESLATTERNITAYYNVAASITTKAFANGKYIFPRLFYGTQGMDWMINTASNNQNGLTLNGLWSKPNGMPGKGYYDPCPKGWRVPDNVNVFSKVGTPNLKQSGDVFITALGNFPLSGYTSGSNAGISTEGAGSKGLYWTGKSLTGTYSTNTTSNTGGEGLRLDLISKNTFATPKESLGSVRCIKDN